MQMYLVMNKDPATAEIVNVLGAGAGMEAVERYDPIDEEWHIATIVERYDPISEEWHKEIVNLSNLMTKEQVSAL